VIELFQAVQHYVQACDISRTPRAPQPSLSFVTGDYVLDNRTAGQVAVDQAKEALNRAEKRRDCEVATDKLLDYYETHREPRGK
jgi:hypothetical protein